MSQSRDELLKEASWQEEQQMKSLGSDEAIEIQLRNRKRPGC